MGRSLTSRPLDLLYAGFLALHIPPSFLLDAQAVLPTRLFPGRLQTFLANYIATSKDPLLSNIQQPHFAWLRAYMWCEISLQVPVFVSGPIALYKGEHSPLYVCSPYAEAQTCRQSQVLANPSALCSSRVDNDIGLSGQYSCSDLAR